jgi:UDP-N-acetylmuramoyl-L-alanyl-D-glutamate--2,6-diaminopimelate ligase
MMAPTYVTDLAELLHDICHVPAVLNTQIFGLQLDSRKVKKGDLFIALAGAKTKATDYINDALKNGANAIVVEGESKDHRVHEDQGAIELAISDLRAWVGVIADRFFGHPSQAMSVIGVTGTNGKTSVSNYAAQLLDMCNIPSGVIGTLGYGLARNELQSTNYTTPDVVEVHKCLAELRDNGAKCVVMEVSSHGLEQGRVDGVRFEGAVFTNLSRDHLDYHGSMDAYASAKKKLFTWKGLKFAVVNADDHMADEFKNAVSTEVSIITYGMRVPAEVYARSVDYRQGICAHVETPAGEFDLKTPLLGAFNLSNLLSVVSIGVAKHLSLPEVLANLAEIEPVPGRMELLRAEGKPVVVIDYAHTPDALENALLALKPHCAGQLVLVFGCGGDRDTGKRSEMANVSEANADQIIVTDDNPRTESPEKIVADILSGFSQNAPVRVVHEREQAIGIAIDESDSKDLILIAGKGHEDYQDINNMKQPFSDKLVARKKLGLVSAQEAVND